MFPGGAAEAGGVREGDVIVAVTGSADGRRQDVAGVQHKAFKVLLYEKVPLNIPFYRVWLLSSILYTIDFCSYLSYLFRQQLGDQVTIEVSRRVEVSDCTSRDTVVVVVVGVVAFETVVGVRS